jgi:glycosyltransferase involved in cell wall biosynthesis
MLYLNVGHTGLNDASLPQWIARHEVRAVHLIHDLIPISYPAFCRPGEAERHSERIANALDSATGIIANSQSTIAEIESFAALRSARMPAHVVAWICGFVEKGAVHPRSLRRPYFVMVGTIEARKNHLLLLQVWRHLVAEMGKATPLLVILGQPGWEAEEALEILAKPGDLSGFVLQLSDCGDDELASWISGARGLLMPTHAEGYGLPVVEALSLGTPVIASDLPVFREIAGDIPTYLSSYDEFGWRSKIRAFSEDDPERERQMTRMASYQAPTWQKHFQLVEDWITTL